MSEQPQPQAMFRLFHVEEEERDPIVELMLPAATFAFYVVYDGHYFQHVGPTEREDIPAGYADKIVSSWDFREIYPKSLHPHSAPDEHPAKCIVCGAPFPLHTIRCGTAA